MNKIAVFLAESSWGAIDETAPNKGLGGRETALVQLAVEWAKQGCEVYAFVPRNDVKTYFPGDTFGFVRWIPNEYTIEVTESVQPELFISWENVEVLAALKTESAYAGQTAIEMQVAHLDSGTTMVSSVADHVCVLSEWAKDFFLTQHPDCENIMKVFPNGVDLARFEHPFGGKDDGTVNFIYSSSPDRGLHHLLAMWPDITKAVMKAYRVDVALHICYGVENYIEHNRWAHRELALRAILIERNLIQPGINYHGKIGQDELAQLMTNCDVMLYPCDTMSPTETGCISIVEALAAGTPVVTTDCDCIGSEFSEVTVQVPLQFSYGDYIAAVVDVLDPEDYLARQEAGRDFAEDRSWGTISKIWRTALLGALSS